MAPEPDAVTRLAEGAQAENALWLLAQLPPEVQRKVRRRFALRLEPSDVPSARYRRELSYIGKLLRDMERDPGWSFACIARKRYDEWRATDSPDTAGSPSSAALVTRYGSWPAVCFRAYQLLVGTGNQNPFPKPKAGRKSRKYTCSEIATALHRCADELDRVPSWNDYKHWSTIARRRTKDARYPSPRLITLHYQQRGGWCAALEDARLIEPPANTVRVWLSLRSEARDLVACARAAGLAAAPPGQRCSTELYASISAARVCVATWAGTAGSEQIVLWEPRTEHLEQIRPA
jgi:hypothetical protein